MKPEEFKIHVNSQGLFNKVKCEPRPSGQAGRLYIGRIMSQGLYQTWWPAIPSQDFLG